MFSTLQDIKIHAVILYQISDLCYHTVHMKKTRKHWWVWLIVFAYIGWIFSNSMMVAEASQEMSHTFTYRLLAIVNRYGFWVDFDLFHHYVRKLAHFAEFSGLGFLVALALCICPLFRWRFINFALFLFLIPVADETIQTMVAGRSSEVFDMFIDGGGILFGGFCGYVLILILCDLFRPRKKQA